MHQHVKLVSHTVDIEVCTLYLISMFAIKVTKYRHIRVIGMNIRDRLRSWSAGNWHCTGLSVTTISSLPATYCAWQNFDLCPSLSHLIHFNLRPYLQVSLRWCLHNKNILLGSDDLGIKGCDERETMSVFRWERRLLAKQCLSKMDIFNHICKHQVSQLFGAH